MIGIIRYTILMLTPCFASLAWAVSIYDIIELSRQGYSDEEVVRIIQGTGSVFDLTAADIPRLKNLGVSETVIRSMLTAVPPDNDSPPDNQANSIRPSLNQFSVQLVSEEASGGHQHAYVTLNDLPILILRDEGRFNSVQNRGKAVARNLGNTVLKGEGRFKAVHVNGEDRVVYQSTREAEIPIVSVNRRDVHAYDIRSEPHVSADMLAAYWAALLNDYWAITFFHQPPSRLANLHRGDALMLLFKLVNENPSDEPLNLGMAVQQLPGVVRRHLQSLARAVPDDFETPSEPIGGSL